MTFYDKYLKYKKKYLNIKKQKGGGCLSGTPYQIHDLDELILQNLDDEEIFQRISECGLEDYLHFELKKYYNFWDLIKTRTFTNPILNSINWSVSKVFLKLKLKIDVNNIINQENYDILDTILFIEENYPHILSKINKLEVDLNEDINGDFYHEIDDFFDIFNNLKLLTIKKFLGEFNNPILGLEKLKTLILYNVNTPFNDALNNLNNLEILILGRYFNQPLGNSLDNLKNLKILFLDTFEDFEYYDFEKNIVNPSIFGRFNQPLGNSLDNLVNLEILSLGSHFNQPLGNSLDNLVNLKKLYLGSYNIQLNNSLDNLINLEYLNLADYNQELGDSLKNLKKLKELNFGQNFNQPLNDSLDNLTNLEILRFYWIEGEFNQPIEKSFDNLKSLKELYFGTDFDQEDISFLLNLKNLERLHMESFIKQRELPNFLNLTNLNYLYLNITNWDSRKDNVTSFRNLFKYLSNIEHLVIIAFKNKNFSLGNSLKYLKNLKYLDLRGYQKPLNNSLNNLTSLEDLELLYYYKNIEASIKNLINLENLHISSKYVSKFGKPDTSILPKFKKLTINDDDQFDEFDQDEFDKCQDLSKEKCLTTPNFNKIGNWSLNDCMLDINHNCRERKIWK